MLVDLSGLARLDVTHCQYRPEGDYSSPLPGGYGTGAVTLTNTSKSTLSVQSEGASGWVAPGETMIVGPTNVTDIDMAIRGIGASSPHASIELDTTTTRQLDCVYQVTGVFDPRP